MKKKHQRKNQDRFVFFFASVVNATKVDDSDDDDDEDNDDGD